MGQLKISVITPSLNSGEFIQRAVMSVREQNYSNTEHIIIDGGSTDNTIEFLESNSDLKWISEPDKGQSDAMNKGFKMSTGDIIVYLNADDYFLPDIFNTVIPLFEKGHMIVMGNVLVKQNEQDIGWLNTPKYCFPEMLRHWELNAFCVNSVGYFYKREVQKRIPFNIDNHDSMDLEFLLNTSLKFDFIKINQTFGVFSYYNKCKTATFQSNPDYWTPKTWPYIEILAKKHLNKNEFKNFINQRNQGYKQRSQQIIDSLKQSGTFNEHWNDDIKKIKYFKKTVDSNSIKFDYLISAKKNKKWMEKIIAKIKLFVVNVMIYRSLYYSNLFFFTYYMLEYPDVFKGGIDPLWHYIKFGDREGRKPNPLFDPKWYRDKYPDIKQHKDINTLLHYFQFGAKEGRDPSNSFSTSNYINQNPDVREAKINPLAHFLLHGIREGRSK